MILSKFDLFESAYSYVETNQEIEKTRMIFVNQHENIS